MDQHILALGNFDGLHRGHIAVLREALSVAARKRMRPVVLLFDRHPKEVLTGTCPPMLMTPEDKARRLKHMGFRVETVSFEGLQNLSPDAFLAHVQRNLAPAALCCGRNYRFGANAAGTVDTLRMLCPARNMEVHVVEDAIVGGRPVSSTRIRALLESGDVPGANLLLGRPFSFAFPVVDGDKRGRVLGFPTLNQWFPPKFVHPRHGVYASKVCLKQVWYPAVTNLGVRPTIGTDSFRSETHIPGFSGDLYGQTVEVHLLEFLRPEADFGSLDALKTQIAADTAAAKEVFERTPNEREVEDQSRLF